MSKWRSIGELHDLTKEIAERDRLFDLYGYSLFAHSAFLSSSFAPDPEWADCVKLTDHARQYIGLAEKAGVEGNREFFAFALFQLFYHHDLFADHLSTDADVVSHLLLNMQSTGEAAWPYVFGSSLYHKFNDWPDATMTDHLDPPDVERLLDGTPAGVFQVGRTVSGPLGFIRGLEERLLPPTRRVLLWHCSDPGCRARHLIKFREYKSPYQSFRDSLARFVTDSLGPSSEWHKPICWIHRIDKWPNGRTFSDIPSVLGDCIIGPERTSLLARSLRSPHNALLTQVAQQAGREIGAPDDFAESLTPEEQHQLLLLLPDRDLVRFIDELVAKKDIRIPPAELRMRKTYTYGPDKDIQSRLSSLGLRSTAHPAVIELASAIWTTYEVLGYEDELVWRLRGHDGVTFRHSVLDFIRMHGPEQTARELIFSSRLVTNAVAETYNLQIFPDEDKENTVRRLLWKLGFNLSRYEDTYEILRNRLQKFRNCVLKVGPELSEADKATVRSIGVNLFVSVETFLEELLCYNVWLLASDHFTGTHFRFKHDAASAAVVNTLGSRITSGTETFAWSTDGSNTLGTLLAYLNEFRSWLKQRDAADRTSVERPEEDYPHYAKDTTWVFPYKHTELWADIPVETLAGYSETVDRICTQLSQADLPSTRNGIDHKRTDDDFPTPDKMLACSSRLHNVVELADAKRMVPKMFWGTKSESDSCGNLCDTFSDYRGSVLSLWDPPLVLGGPRKSFGTPYLIAPADFLQQPNTMLLFTIVAKSEYSEYWKDYPRRRFIPPTTEESTPDMKADYQAELED